MPQTKKIIQTPEWRTEALDKFMAFLGRFGTLPAEVRAFLLPNLRIEAFAKKTVFWPRSLRSEYIYFVASGTVRSTYLLPDGEEVTNWLVGTGEIATIPISLFTGALSDDDLQAVTDAVVIKIPYQLLNQNFEQMPYLNRIRVAVMEQYILRYDERCRFLRMRPAQAQLDTFQMLYREIFNTVPLQMVASYLGISKTTLARLRQYQQ